MINTNTIKYKENLRRQIIMIENRPYRQLHNNITNTTTDQQSARGRLYMPLDVKEQPLQWFKKSFDILTASRRSVPSTLELYMSPAIEPADDNPTQPNSHAT
jgi:hypothetical protein